MGWWVGVWKCLKSGVGGWIGKVVGVSDCWRTCCCGEEAVVRADLMLFIFILWQV